jgi:O-acetyl-ADP-ribose deacetylase
MSRLELVLGDITRERVDAIVNAANAGLVGGGGVDGEIHRVGGPAIMADCDRIRDERAGEGACPTGTAVATTAGKLPAKTVIHTAAPRWHGGRKGEPALLASCYRSSLQLAASLGHRTVAIPSLGTGAYGYPVAKAADVAIATILDVLDEKPAAFDAVKMVLFSKADLAAYRKAHAAALAARGAKA